jgi:hypothetical protein
LRIDNLQMDMTSVELSVANAHHQVQHVEDEVVTPLSQKVSNMYQDFFMSGGAMESRFDSLLEEHHERLNSVELVNRIAAEKCDSVWDVLTSWMVTFEALETSVGSVAARAQTLEDNQEWLASHSAAMTDMSRNIRDLYELSTDQAATIKLLQERVGELELGHGVLRAHVIHIEVRMSMVA